jgi:hypothetical protein
MEVPGGCLEVTQVSMDDGGFESGVITASYLYSNFDFECIGCDVSLFHLWPRGPCIVVRFHSTVQFVDVFPVLKVAQLRSVSAIHACRHRSSRSPIHESG